MDKSKRKELAYKFSQEKQTAGVFRIYNKESKRSYLGTSMNIEKTFNRHASELKFHTHHNSFLQEDWDKYGEASFSIEIEMEAKEDRIIDFSYLKRLEDDVYKRYLDQGIIPERLLQ